MGPHERPHPPAGDGMVWDLRPDGGLQLAVILLLGGLTLYSWWKAVHPELPEDENEQNVA